MQLLKVRFLQSAAGIRTNFKKGGEYTLPFIEAKSFIRANIAVPVVEKETAIIQAKETRDVQDSHSTSGGADKPDRSKTISKGNGHN